jgi:hypothetical protein
MWSSSTAQQAEEAGQRVDRDGVPLLQRLGRDEHRERGLPGPDVALEPDPLAVREVGLEPVDVLADLAHHRRLDQRHRRAVEADALVAARDHAGELARLAAGEPAGAAAAVARFPRVFVIEEAGAVAAAVGALGH